MSKTKKDYVCSCHKITKSDMKNEIKDGVTEFKLLQKNTKIGTKCSSCKKENKKRFAKYLKKQNKKQVST